MMERDDTMRKARNQEGSRSQKAITRLDSRVIFAKFSNKACILYRALRWGVELTERGWQAFVRIVNACT